MTLTAAEYEKYKTKLTDATKERSILEAKRAQLIEHLRLTYQLTPEEAKQEVVKLKEELPKLEEELETKYKEFNDKWQSLMQ